ncbi:MAG: hypothetical protein ABSF22_20780 [Bryobacteraceae bacterium]
MNLIPDKVGGNKKQLIWLGGLLVVLVGVYIMNRDPSTPAQPATQVTLPKTSIARQGPVVPDTSSGPKLATRSGGRDGDFRPSLKLPEGTDITKIDPTLKTELLAKLQKVPLEGGARSVFDWGQAPVPPPPPVAKIDPKVIEEQKKKADEQIAYAKEHPVKPVPPPIPLKFYGYANRLSGPARQAFFLDGEDIQIKGENDVIRGRYKIIRIGVNSATVEDLQSHDQQTLPLVAELNT